jgi:hypothetical protein
MESKPIQRFAVSVSSNDAWVIWGGLGESGVPVDDGYRFSSATGMWSPMSKLNAPSPRASALGVSIGSRVWVWGGEDLSELRDDGAIYDPASDAWEEFVAPSEVGARKWAHVAWLESVQHIVIWGGESTNGLPTNTGWTVDPSTNEWTAMSDAGAPPPTINAGATQLAGNKFLVFGGLAKQANGASVLTNAMYVYDAELDSWSSVDSADPSCAPSPRMLSTVTALAGRSVVWGGIPEGDTTTLPNEDAFLFALP